MGEEKRAGQDPMIASFLKTVQDSTGVIKTGKRDGDMVLEEELEQWKVEFGDEVAEALMKRVKDALPDYHYLRSLRLRC